MEGITVMEPPPMVRLYRGHMLFTLLGSNPATAVYVVVREDGIVAQRRSGINVPTAWTLQITQALERLKIMIAEGVLSPFYDDAITAYTYSCKQTVRSATMRSLTMVTRAVKRRDETRREK